jgi:hypothetical protein
MEQDKDRIESLAAYFDIIDLTADPGKGRLSTVVIKLVGFSEVEFAMTALLAWRPDEHVRPPPLILCLFAPALQLPGGR